jgi:hypothetical protein
MGVDVPGLHMVTSSQNSKCSPKYELHDLWLYDESSFKISIGIDTPTETQGVMIPGVV